MKRVQRKRTKGYKMPENTKYVGRPTKWGNPFRLTSDGYIQNFSTNRTILDPWIMWSVSNGFETKDVVELYEMWLKGRFKHVGYLPTPPDIEELRGKNLACFCNLEKPCHVDVLIQLLSERE